MNTLAHTTDSAPPRRRSRPMQAAALTTLAAFVTATVGCADRAPPDDVVTGDIAIRSEVLKDGVYVEALTETMPFSEVPGWDREIIVDGVRTTDLGLLRGAGVVSIQLNTNETLTLRAVGDGDTFEIEGASPRPGEPMLTALRLTDSAIEFYVRGSNHLTNRADLVIHIDGLSGDLLASTLDRLAMYSLIASAEDSPQLAWFVVAGILGAGWLLICGYELDQCSSRCEKCPGFKFQCFGFSLESKDGDWSVEVGGTAGCECIQPCRES